MRSHATPILNATLLVAALSSSATAQEPSRGRGAAPRVVRPPLLFREEWKQTAAGGEHPVNPSEALSNPNLELKLYGREVLLTAARRTRTIRFTCGPGSARRPARWRCATGTTTAT